MSPRQDVEVEMRGLRKVLIGAALLGLVLLGARGIHDLTHRPTSPVQAVAAHPMPPLFRSTAMAAYTAHLDAQAREAATLLKGWWSSHGTKPQDSAFAAWLKDQVPAPPGASSRKSETGQLEGLARTRNASGAKAARWLKKYGARDLWLFYEHQQATHESKGEQRARHRQLARLLGMARKLGTSLNQKLGEPAPFVLDARLRSGKAPSGRGGCPCSYPTGADMAAAAGSTFLAALDDQHASRYRHMADEYEFAQLYLGSRLPSDLDAGRLLGDMVGEYFLVTRGDGSPQHVTGV